MAVLIPGEGATGQSSDRGVRVWFQRAPVLHLATLQAALRHRTVFVRLIQIPSPLCVFLCSLVNWQTSTSRKLPFGLWFVPLEKGIEILLALSSFKGLVRVKHESSQIQEFFIPNRRESPQIDEYLSLLKIHER